MLVKRKRVKNSKRKKQTGIFENIEVILFYRKPFFDCFLFVICQLIFSFIRHISTKHHAAFNPLRNSSSPFFSHREESNTKYVRHQSFKCSFLTAKKLYPVCSIFYFSNF